MDSALGLFEYFPCFFYNILEPNCGAVLWGGGEEWRGLSERVA